MQARYGEWTPDLQISSPRGCSSFWKEVCRFGQIIRGNVSWMIGDGSSIHVIQDTWISDLPLSRWPSFISIDTPSSLRVKDLISSNPPAWHIPSVTRFCGTELARRILSIPLSPGCLSDSRLWKRSCLSRAPTRDLMQIFRPISQRSIDATWIWKLPTLPRVQLFMWKLMWDCLPTCLFLSRRGLSIQPCCPLCRLEEESSEHAIFICPRARQIWHMVGYSVRLENRDSARSSFFLDIRGASRQRCGLWAAAAYHIWLSRNQLLFTDDSISSLRIMRKVRSLAADFARVGSDVSGLWGSPAVSAANRHTVFISWDPPPPGFIKINFDGSVRDRVAGSAFIIRGPCGELLGAGGFGSIDSSVPMAELYAAWAGISYAVRTLQAQRIVIEGDSKTAISWIKKENYHIRPAIPMLRDIWSLLRLADYPQIRHIYREANSAADWAASFVAQHDGSWLWRPIDPCPSGLQQILYSDCSGLTRTRLV